MKSRLTSVENIAILALAVIPAIPVSAQSQRPDIYAQTSELALDLANNTSSVRQWFSSHGSQVTKEHAVAAEEMATQAMRAGDESKAYPYSAFAMYAFLYLGDSSRSLQNRVVERDLTFEAAKTAERYEFVRQTVLQSHEEAASIGRSDLAFDFAVLAADCSFFSSSAKPGGKADEPLFNTLNDAAAALNEFRPGFSRLWLERLISLTAAAIQKAKRIAYFGDEETRMNGILKRLSASVDLHIPPNFEYTFPRWGDSRKSIAAARVFADLSYESGDAEIARQRLNVAADRAKQMQDQELWLAIIVQKYDLERAAGVSSDRLRSLRDEARNGSHGLRAAYHSRAGRIWAGHRADQFYGELLRDQLSESPELTQASFSFVEALKARTLLDVLYFPPVPGPVSADTAKLEERALGFPAAFAISRINAGRSTQEAAKDVRTSEARLISHLAFFREDVMSAYGEGGSPRMDAIAQLETAYKQTFAGFHAVAVPASLAEVQQSLGPREAVLEYVIPYHRSHPAFDLYILLITRTAARTVHIALNELLPFNIPMIGTLMTNETATEYSQLGQMIVDLRTAIQIGNERSAQASLRELYKVLIQPLTTQGVRLEDFDRLVIVPHGPLHYVPFAALMDGQGKYLISKTALVVAPSASVWLTLTKRSRPVQKFVGFGSPDLSRLGAGELKYAAQEMIDIPKLLPAANPSVFVGPDATEDRFVEQAPSANILHISTHGEFPEEDAIDLHAFLLAKGKYGDGTVRAARVRQLKLSSTSLVALSVCNGALYRIGPADEPYGLIPAFLEAGSQNVLGTLWKLDEQFGKDFMEEFYQHVMHDGPAGAYQRTCVRFLNADEDLRNWAAFVLVGPGRPFATATIQ